MKRFAALLDRLDTAADDDTATRVLADYLARAPDPDRGAALGVLLGATRLRRAGPAVVRGLAAQRLDDALLAIGRDVTGDLGEAVALMWPASSNDTLAPSVSSIVAALAATPPSPERLADWLDRFGPAERVALIRLTTGRLQPRDGGQVSVAVAQAALARLGGASLGTVQAAWADAAPPDRDLFERLAAPAAARAPAPAGAFRPLATLRAFDDAQRADLDPAAHAVERAWDGVRVLAVARGNERRLFSRRGEDVAARFATLLDALAFQGAIEGVVVETQGAARLLVHDLLAHGDRDLTGEPLRARRDALTTLVDRLGTDAIHIASLLDAPDWGALDAARAAARDAGAEGLVLKRWDAPYPASSDDAPWLLWACAPHRIRAALLYVEHARRDAAATFGVWSGDALVPLAKTPLDDAAGTEAILAHVREHAIDRVGPVLQVEASARTGLVVELAFARVEPAPRRKSGVSVLSPRVVGIIDGAAPSTVARVEDVRALVC